MQKIKKGNGFSFGKELRKGIIEQEKNEGNGKEFYDLNKMKNIKIVSNKTTVDYKKQSFIYDFLSSMRQKVNDPLGKRKRD